MVEREEMMMTFAEVKRRVRDLLHEFNFKYGHLTGPLSSEPAPGNNSDFLRRSDGSSEWHTCECVRCRWPRARDGPICKGGRLHEDDVITAQSFNAGRIKVKITSCKPIGRGASGNVFQGERADGSPVAVKVGHLAHIPKDIGLLRRELRTVRSTNHHNILPFLGASTIVEGGSRLLLISRYMSNGNMADYLKRFPTTEKPPLVMQVARAVTYLHDTLGTVHGDLKCENVLISDSGAALLADFGLSTRVEKPKAETSTDSSVCAMYSLRHAAPELLADKANNLLQEGRRRSKTKATDVYAIGMLILEAFTGKTPWDGHTDMAVIINVHSGRKPDRPPVFGLTDEWWGLCRRTWAYKPKKRPTMAKICKSLERIIDSKSRILKGHTGHVESVAYTADGERVVSASADRMLFVRDVKTGLSVFERPMCHIDTITALAVSPDGKRIVSGGSEGFVCLWDAKTGAPVASPLQAHESCVSSIACSPDGRQFVTVSNDGIRIWDSSTGEPIERPPSSQLDAGAYCTAFSADGAFYASGSVDGTISIWSAQTHDLVGVMDQGAPVTSLAISPDNQHIVSTSSDDNVRLWNVESMSLEDTMCASREGAPPGAALTSIAFSPKGTLFATGSGDGTVALWDMAKRRPVDFPQHGHDGTVSSVAFSPDGTHLASASWDTTVRLWDVPDACVASSQGTSTTATF